MGGVIFWPLFLLAVTPLVLTTPAHATDDNTVSITVDPAAQLTRQGDFYKATTNVAVKTGKPYGFDLTMKADGNGDLVNTVDPSHRISNMQGNSMYSGIEGIPANSWGYHSGDWHHNGSTIPVYGHVPAAKDNETTLLGVTAAEQKGCSTNHSNCSKDVVFAANIDPLNLASGSYSTTITYTATAKPAPKPVDWTNRAAKTDPSETCEAGNTNSSCLVDLDPNMIPVIYDDTNAKWKSVADPEAPNSGWYNYVNKQWANAITVKPEALAKYRGFNKVVDQADILGFWVYIPRYRYKVLRFSGSDPAVPAQNFTIEFENKQSTKATPTANGTWATHPAFTFGSKELNGIWFAKFETTGTTGQPTVLPNEAHISGYYSGMNNQIGNFYSLSKTLGVEDRNNVGGSGFTTTQNNHHLAKLSSHMVNNNDWGAATYLSASKYGAGYNKVQINSSVTEHTYGYAHGYTGCGPSSNGNTDTYNDGGTYGTQSACSSSDSRRAYNGSIGQLASTTNNVYGIYDMSGGGYEYVAAGYSDNLNSSNANHFDSVAHPPYVNTYNITSLNSCTFTTCGGQALYETNDGVGTDAGSHMWNAQYMDFRLGFGIWFYRGGGCYGGSDAGLFRVVAVSGDGYDDFTFRVALAPTVQN